MMDIISINAVLQETPEMQLAKKLENNSPITKADIQALDLYNDFYIDKLLNSSQENLRTKLAEVIAHLFRPDKI